MPKFKAPQTANVVWLHPNGVVALDRETGRERPFYRYAFKRIGDDPKVVHIGAIQTGDRAMAQQEIMSLINWPALNYGTMFFEVLKPAMKDWR